MGRTKMILLDTHIWLWWISNPELLSGNAAIAIENAIPDQSICISSISAWEIALLVQKGRLELSIDVRDWINKTESLPFVNFIPVDNSIGIKSVSLPPPLHNDPADRIIVATSLIHNIELVTKDEMILAYSPVSTIW